MVDRTLFERYARALSTNADMAQTELSTLLREYLSDLGARELLDVLRDLWPALVAKYGNRAAQVACEFYEAQRALAAPERAYDPVPAVADADAARADLFSRVGGSTTPDAVARMLPGQLVRLVDAQADSTITANAQADPAHPRWALVPRPGACGWCVLIGSRGFDYRRGGTVPRHDNCRCTTVADFDRASPSLPGYDPDGLAARYAGARREVEAQAQAEWSRLDQSARNRYKTPNTSAYQAFLRNKVVYRLGRDRTAE